MKYDFITNKNIVKIYIIRGIQGYCLVYILKAAFDCLTLSSLRPNLPVQTEKTVWLNQQVNGNMSIIAVKVEV